MQVKCCVSIRCLQLPSFNKSTKYTLLHSLFLQRFPLATGISAMALPILRGRSAFLNASTHYQPRLSMVLRIDPSTRLFDSPTSHSSSVLRSNASPSQFWHLQIMSQSFVSTAACSDTHKSEPALAKDVRGRSQSKEKANGIEYLFAAVCLTLVITALLMLEPFSDVYSKAKKTPCGRCQNGLSGVDKVSKRESDASTRLVQLRRELQDVHDAAQKRGLLRKVDDRKVQEKVDSIRSEVASLERVAKMLQRRSARKHFDAGWWKVFWASETPCEKTQKKPPRRKKSKPTGRKR